MSTMDLRGVSPAPVTAFNRDGDLDYEANANLARWLASVDGVKSLVILGHAGEGTFLTSEEQVDLIRTLCRDGRRQHSDHRRHHRRRHQGRGARGQAGGGRRRHRRAGLPEPRLAALRLPEGRAAGPLQGDPRGVRPAVHPVPVPATHQGDLRPEDPARDRRAARRRRHQERRARHEALVHRDPGAAPRVPGPADPDLPRRVAAADDVRRRRPAGRLWRAGAGAAGRVPRRRQGARTTTRRARSTTGCCR